jgi:hypothetical protein
MKLTLRSLFTVSCLAAFMTFGAAAHADTFTFAWESTGQSGIGTGAGTLTAVTDINIPNALDVTGISGTVDGSPIIGLLPCAAYDPGNPGSSSGNSFFYDNLLYPGGTGAFGITVLDFRGIGLDLGNGVEGSYYASSSHQTSFITNLPHDNGHLASFSITALPEPGSFILFGTGLLFLGIAGAVRHRIKS